MSKVKINDKVLRLKNDFNLSLPNTNDVFNFKGGQEFHIVADVLYMGGYPLPMGLQNFLIGWINDNPNLFVNDTRNW